MKLLSVFLDTNVFDSQNYNFESTVLTSFAIVAKDKNITLLMHDVVEREVRRHMKKRSQEALSLLDDIRRKAPFLIGFKSFPTTESTAIRSWEPEFHGRKEWRKFIDQFNIVNLGYENIDLKEIMDWYDKSEAPFAVGKKQKEFPDALVLSALNLHCQKTPGEYIAVVSSDTDFKSACDRYPSMLHFSSLPRLIESLLKDDSEIEKARLAIDNSLDIIAAAIDEACEGIAVVHRYPEYSVIGSKHSGSDIIDIRIIGLGDEECTAVFEVEVVNQICLKWMDIEYNRGPDYGPEAVDKSDWITETINVEGVTKLRFNSDKNQIKEVVLIELDDQEYEIHSHPHGY